MHRCIKILVILCIALVFLLTVMYAHMICTSHQAEGSEIIDQSSDVKVPRFDICYNVDLQDMKTAANVVKTPANCGMCHPINSEDRKIGPQLSDLYERMTQKDLIGWLREHLYSPPRLFMFEGNKGPSEDQFNAIACFLWYQ